ncbi:MAG TPA: hypothetical protein VMY37_00085, partial [Thermoguttaceae bacterium]|nr:hypothetical protein [Thermoguttaceae bacterium]
MSRDCPFDTMPMDQMIRTIKANLGQRERNKPVYTMLVGAGFSVPLVPTAGRMLGDIVWWLFRNANGVQGPFDDRPREQEGLKDYEKELWRVVQQDCPVDFELGDDGRPNHADPANAGKAYQAIMSNESTRGLTSPMMRRQYLRDVVTRAGNRVNGAHIYLAGILQAQEDWDLG